MLISHFLGVFLLQMLCRRFSEGLTETSLTLLRRFGECGTEAPLSVGNHLLTIKILIYKL